MTAKKIAGAGAAANKDGAPTEQSAAERRLAEADVSALIAAHAPTHARLVGSARRWLQTRLPTANELVYEYRDNFVISYSPNENGYDGVLALRASATRVLLYFNQGKDLPDPAKLLKGTGKVTRSMTLDSATTLARPEVASLIDATLAKNLIPYARTGHGSVLIRSTAAKQRRAVQSKEPS